ncbi:hypothetical protein BVRB_6g132640 [Beta vulgaris subsp. vulgaris]|nr:hypothetical protein BVRB_6g132640 [Beta vulgaris subsp. vulgaris]
MFFYNSGNVPKIGISLVVLIIAILYLVGMLYMFLTWQLSDVVSVMEKNCGLKALKKSKELIKGKMGIAFAMLVLNLLLGIPTLILIQKLAGFGIVARILFGILSLVLWSLFNLFVLVVQTVFYLVCKSNNYESIKDLSLDNDLGEYVTLDTEVTNLEQSLV